MSLLALFILFPLLFALVAMLVKTTRLLRLLGVAGSIVLLTMSVYLIAGLLNDEIWVLYTGNWPAPFGITLVADKLAAAMLLATSVIALSAAVYAFNYVDEALVQSKFYVFFFTLLMGVNGAFVTGDVFNLYVWFEVMLMSSFVLIVLGSTQQQLEGGIKYLALNLLGSLLFLAGLGLLYGKTGTLNMAHLAEVLSHSDKALLMNTSAMFFFVAFGIKAAIFPMFFWLPASYHTPNITVSALFAGLLTKVGVYVLIRFFTLFFVQDKGFWHPMLTVAAGATMVFGGMSASVHYDTRRILSYHIISQIGYMIMGLAIYTPLAIAGAIYFTIHNMFAKTNTFLIAGLINRAKGTYYLKDVGGLLNQSPLLAVLFVVPAFALAGVPPFSGFFAKFSLIKAGFATHDYAVTFIALFTGLLTLYSMIKIWFEAFLKKQPGELGTPARIRFRVSELLPSVLLGLLSLTMGVLAAPVFAYLLDAANALLDPTVYVNEVLQMVK